MTTIKILSDGRTLTTDGARLYLDGADVGAASLTPLATPKGGMVAYAKTSAGALGFTREDVAALNAAARPAVTEDPEHRARREGVARKYREWNRLHNDGGEGYNPFADKYRELFGGQTVEPRHPADY